MKLSEIAMTTGDLAFGLPKPKKAKKPMGDDENYDNDPVTGEPRKGRKKTGKVLLASELEESKKSKKSKKEKEENIRDQKWNELENIIKLIGDRSLEANQELDRRLASQFISRLHSLGSTYDSYSQFVLDVQKLWKLKRDPSAAFASPTFYDPVGYGLIKPRGAPQGRLERLLDTVWFMTIVTFTNWAKNILSMAENLRENQLVLNKVLNEKEASLENIYKMSVQSMNAKLAPEQSGPPIMGIHKGERLSDLCSCKKCKHAKTYKDMCSRGQKALMKKPLSSYTKSLSDVGIRDGRKGWEPTGRRIPPS